jgi:type I restriction enzyme R subunit
VSEFSVEFFAPWGEITAHERRLPHWQQGGVAIFATWRLADALPTKRLAAWRIERETWLAQHPKPWSTAIQQAYADRLEQSVDRWLDAGYGACLLRNPAARSEAVRALQHFDGVRYCLHAWVVMPNHVHVLFSPHADETAGRIIGGWKGVSARRIHQQLGPGSATVRKPTNPPAHLPFWQSEYWDTLVRSPGHFAACRRYIAENPARANLAESDYALWPGAPAY